MTCQYCAISLIKGNPLVPDITHTIHKGHSIPHGGTNAYRQDHWYSNDDGLSKISSLSNVWLANYKMCYLDGITSYLGSTTVEERHDWGCCLVMHI